MRHYPHRDFSLGPEETTILRCLAAGLTRSEAAAVTGIPLSSVHYRMQRVRMRLAAKTDTHAVALVVAAGLLYPQS